MQYSFFLSVILITICGYHSFSQSLAINTTGAAASTSAILDVSSTAKGMLIPRMTTAQRTAIATPATGLQVYDTDLNLLFYYSGAAWTSFATGGNYWTSSGGNIYNNTGTNVGIGAVTPGDKLEINGNLKFTGTSNIYCGTATNLTIRPGDGTGSGGALTIRGGNAGITSGGAGGDLNLIAGANLPLGGSGYTNLGVPGVLNITGSYGYNSTGGNINIKAGATSCWALPGGNHSDVFIAGGANLVVTDPSSIMLEGGYTIGTSCSTTPGSTGGNLILKSGLASGAGTNGNIQLLNGNVGIGTSAPSSKLEVCGNVRVIGTIVASGTITTSAIVCPSDFRYKKNITVIANPMQKLLRLNGVNYYWKSNEFPNMNFNDKMQTGFIAQDVEKIFPEMVFTDDKGYKSLDYARLTPLLVETIKEQQKQIDEIVIRLKDLEKSIKKQN